MAQDNQIKVELTAVDKNLAAVFAKAEASMRMFAATGNQLDSIFGGIGKGVALLTAALAGGSMFGSAVAKTKEVAGEVKTLKEAFGITAEEASVLRVALDDTFISSDVVIGASARLTKQIVSNGEAFKRLGIDINDSSGKARPIIDVLIEANDKIKEFDKGFSQNAAATELYGKGWESLRDILKLNSGAMEDAKSRAAELNLVFGEDGLKDIKAYKSAMKDLEDVVESIKVQVGRDLIPELTKVGAEFSKAASGGIHDFILGLHAVEAEFIRLGMLADKFGGTLTTIVALAGTLGRIDLDPASAALTSGTDTAMTEWAKQQNTMFEQRYNEGEKRLQTMANLEVGLDADGNRIVAKTTGGAGDGGKQYTPKAKETNMGAAQDKEFAYLKAVAEKELALKKATFDQATTSNELWYAWNLESLASYLQNEFDLNKKYSDAEIATKQKEYDDAKRKAGELKPVVGKKGESRPDKDAANQYEALVKVENAEKALIEVQSRGIMLDLTGKQKILESTIKHQEELKKTAISVAELNGEWDKSYQLQLELLDLEIKEAENTKNGKEKIDLLVRQREELEKMRDPLTALSKGFADVAKEWSSHAKNMVDVGATAAKALQTGFSDFFFDAMQGKLKTLGDYLSSFINSMQRALADMWSKELVSGLKGADGSMLSGIGSFVSGLFHSGGLIGTDAASSSRAVSPLAFAGAQRYHGGLLPDEFPAILQKGEGVFTRGQMAALGGGSGSSSTVINIIEAPGRGGQQQQRQGSNGVSVIDVFVEQIKAAVATDITRGSGAVPNALQTTYGLNRTAGAY